jgi:outer membrane immunogenic protein
MKIAISLAMMAASVWAMPASAQTNSGLRTELKLGKDSSSLAFFGMNLSKSGLLYGGEIGYDVQVTPTLSLGLDAEATASSIRYPIKMAYVPTTYTLSVARDLYTGARLTLVGAKNFNIYLKAGYANGRTSLNTALLHYPNNSPGFRKGIGAQYSVTPHLYVSAEYRHTQYGEAVSRQQIVSGLGYRF